MGGQSKLKLKADFGFECYRAVCVQMRMQMMVSVEDTAMVEAGVVM